jgi:cytosine/adenosine deaminase-related metal-dependent hydrolase
MDADGIARWHASGAALCWCPSSNLFLFGRTAPADLFDGQADILLGSDSRLTGAGDMLDELRIARRIGLLDDERLDAAVGTTAARRLGLPDPVLTPGSAADLIILSRPLGEATAADIQLVLVAGQPRVASPDLALMFDRLFPGGRQVRRGPLTRWVWGEMHDGKDLHRGAGETGALAATGIRH